MHSQAGIGDSAAVDLYDGHYGRLASAIQTEVRRETYDEDLGQASWMTAAEARTWFELLRLGPAQLVLEVACGSGGVTCAMARETGATCVGVDVNALGIEAARQQARREGLVPAASFHVLNAAARLPFPDGSFDAVFCNDSINHLPDRPAVLREWHRVLRPGSRVLFTDPAVVTGQLSNEDIRARSSIGFFLFTPLGHNERLLENTRFTLREVRDVTPPVAAVARRWHTARSARRAPLIDVEGHEAFEGVQRFLDSACALAHDRRLSRFMYCAGKRP